MNIVEDIKVPEMDATASLPASVDLRHWALFLDVDGTLLDIAASPESVVIPTALPRLLDDLRNASGGALALVTGREIATVDRFFSPLVFPVAGIHGAELRLPDGTISGTAINPTLPRIVAQLRAFVADNEGLLLETKGRAVAVHYRLNPAIGEDVERLVRRIVESEDDGLEVQPGKMVVEVRPARVDKGRALEIFLETEPYAGRCPLVIGDDFTDEAAFRTANARGGRSIRVGRDRRPTEANESLPDPTAVRNWLAGLVEAQSMSSAARSF